MCVCVCAGGECILGLKCKLQFSFSSIVGPEGSPGSGFRGDFELLQNRTPQEV